eukprot:jgi/Mesvir1/20243/Mv25415-RA.1
MEVEDLLTGGLPSPADSGSYHTPDRVCERGPRNGGARGNGNGNSNGIRSGNGNGNGNGNGHGNGRAHGNHYNSFKWPAGAAVQFFPVSALPSVLVGKFLGAPSLRGTKNYATVRIQQISANFQSNQRK